MDSPVLGIDIGGTQVKWGWVGREGVHAFYVLETPEEPETLVDWVHETVRQHPGIRGIGIGVPGMVDEEGTIHHPPNLPKFHGFPLKQAIEQRVHVPVYVENDANLIALGEWKFGAARGSRHAVVLTLGTGIGTGFICDGRLVRGYQGRGSEGGHIILDPNGPPCYCGNRGCLESFLGTVHFIPRARTALKQQDPHLPDLEQLDAERLYRLARSGHPVARSLWKEYGYWLGIGIVNFVHLFGPEVVVLGGGVAGAFEAFAPTLLETLKTHVMGYAERNLRVVRAELGMKAGVMGAWALFEEAE